MIGEIIVTVLGIAWGACFGALIYCNHKIMRQNTELLEWLERQADTIAILEAKIDGRFYR